jgi:hypothetical protein
MVQGCLSGLLRSLTLVIRSVNVARAREGQSKRLTGNVASHSETLHAGGCTHEAVRGRRQDEPELPPLVLRIPKILPDPTRPDPPQQSRPSATTLTMLFIRHH